MIPDYIVEGAKDGTPVIYGHGLKNSPFPERDVIFYSGKISTRHEGDEIVVSSTDPRFFSNLTTLDKHTDFLFKLDERVFVERPWASELRELLKSDLEPQERENRTMAIAIENVLNQFLEIGRNRSKFYSERYASERV